MEDVRHLVQILLPLCDNTGQAQDQALFAQTRTELTERFGGMTAHVRAPARGLWQAADGEVERDDIVILEVLADALDRPWWQRYRRELETRFAQEVVIIRTMRIEII